MTEEEIKAKEEAEALAAQQAEEEAKKAAEDAKGGPKLDADGNPVEKDIDYVKALEELENSQPVKRSEKEKAAYTVKKIYERFPDLNAGKKEDEDEDDKIASLRTDLLRQQVEGIIRREAKTEDEVKYYMRVYDLKTVKTGNIHEDADNALWLANKDRTRNALKEIKRKPADPGPASGSGQRGDSGKIPELSQRVQAELIRNDVKQTAPDTWEGTKVMLKYNKQAKQWDQTNKP